MQKPFQKTIFAALISFGIAACSSNKPHSSEEVVSPTIIEEEIIVIQLHPKTDKNKIEKNDVEKEVEKTTENANSERVTAEVAQAEAVEGEQEKADTPEKVEVVAVAVEAVQEALAESNAEKIEQPVVTEQNEKSLEQAVVTAVQVAGENIDKAVSGSIKAGVGEAAVEKSVVATVAENVEPQAASKSIESLIQAPKTTENGADAQAEYEPKVLQLDWLEICGADTCQQIVLNNQWVEKTQSAELSPEQVGTNFWQANPYFWSISPTLPLNYTKFDSETEKGYLNNQKRLFINIERNF